MYGEDKYGSICLIFVIADTWRMWYFWVSIRHPTMADNKKLIVIVSLPGTRLLSLAGATDVFSFAAAYPQDWRGMRWHLCAAKAGLLHNKRATAHWERNEQLQKLYPDIQVDTTPFFIKDGNIYTSGGVTSGIDLALTMVEEDLGREIALRVARRIVVHLRPPGNQSQFGALLPDYELNSHLLRSLRPWIMDHIEEDLRVELNIHAVIESTGRFTQREHYRRALKKY